MKAVRVFKVILATITLFIATGLITSDALGKNLVPTGDAKSNSSKVATLVNEDEASSTKGNKTFLTKLTAHVFEMLDLKQVLNDIEHSKSTPATCYACKFGMALAKHLVEFGKSKEEIAALTNTICVMLNIESPRVCKGIARVFKDEFVTVLVELTLSPTEVCGMMFGDGCGHNTNPLYNWTIPLSPVPKPPVAPKTGSWRPGDPVLRILQLSDIHIDEQYAIGGDAACGEPLCCRPSIRADIQPGQLSGYWGDYRNCDIPLRTLDSMLKHISAHHSDLDMIFWTGDVPAHDIWNQTKQGQINILRTVTKLLDKHLGHFPILPALGNHESNPVNAFPRPELGGSNSISWLYNELTDLWSKWLPTASLASIKKGAYYSVYIRPGLKLISLNMNYCNNQNWWLLLNSTDPADELTWLLHELQMSEILGEKAFIIGHIPPGSNDCLQVWSRNYYRIINRYENTIVAQFFGHTHQDEFEIFYDDSAAEGSQTRESPVLGTLRPTNVAYISPSVTTYEGVNPGYRIYTVDAKTFEVLNHETYYTNLTEANEHGEKSPLWFQLAYTAKESYGMASLEPAEWHRVVMDMIHDETLFQQFYTYFYNKSDFLKVKPCSDQVCKGDLLCKLVSGKSHDFALCQKFFKDLEHSVVI